MDEVDQVQPVDYAKMYPSGDTSTDASVKVSDDHVYGATATVDGIDLVFDETDNQWVTVEGHEPWSNFSDTPPVVPEEAEPPIEEKFEKPDSPFTHALVNIEANRRLRLRKEPNMEGEVLTELPNKKELRVITDSNPDWTFVETVDDGGNTVRGYVKSSLISKE